MLGEAGLSYSNTLGTAVLAERWREVMLPRPRVALPLPQHRWWWETSWGCSWQGDQLGAAHMSEAFPSFGFAISWSPAKLKDGI